MARWSAVPIIAPHIEGGKNRQNQAKPIPHHKYQPTNFRLLSFPSFLSKRRPRQCCVSLLHTTGRESRTLPVRSNMQMRNSEESSKAPVNPLVSFSLFRGKKDFEPVLPVRAWRESLFHVCNRHQKHRGDAFFMSRRFPHGRAVAKIVCVVGCFFKNNSPHDTLVQYAACLAPLV